MKAVFQRVTQARVTVQGQVAGEINGGALILLGVSQQDGDSEALLLAKKIAQLRVFADEEGKMNRSLLDVQGQALVVSQFTLFADLTHGRRPSFFEAAAPEPARRWYEAFCDHLREQGIQSVERGVFGADMEVSLVNDGPVTILLDTDQWRK